MTEQPREFPVDTWEMEVERRPTFTAGRLKPVMPDGSREVIDGTWILPTGERVRPVKVP